jgi:hypothetical protein
VEEEVEEVEVEEEDEDSVYTLFFFAKLITLNYLFYPFTKEMVEYIFQI